MSRPPRDFFSYLAPHPLEALWGLQVVAGGRTHIAARQPYPPAGHPAPHSFTWPAGRTLVDEFQVVLITRGSGTFRSRAGGERAVAAGTAFLLFPGEWHAYRPHPQTGWDELWLACAGEVPARLLAAGVIAPARPLIAADSDPDLVDAFALALDRLEREPAGFRAELAVAALGVFARLGAIVTGQDEPPPHRARLRATARRIQEGCTDRLDIAGLAAEAALSPAQFRRLFHAAFGMSPKAYYQHHRLLRARRLLTDRSLPVGAVAARLGFANALYFTRLFTRHVGMAPGRWRSRFDDP